MTLKLAAAKCVSACRPLGESVCKESLCIQADAKCQTSKLYGGIY